MLNEEELNALKQPISDEAPSGQNCEYDELYLKLDSQALETPDSQMGDSVVEGQDPDFRALYKSCLELFKKTHDLRVACYFTLSSTCLYGFEGLKQGLQIVDYLVENEFDTVYPLLDPDDDNDPTERINVFAMLSPSEGSYSDPYMFIGHLRKLKIVSELPYSYRDYLMASGFLESKNNEDLNLNIMSAQMSSIPGSSVKGCYECLKDIIALVDSICDKFNQKVGDRGYLTMDSLKHEISVLINYLKSFLNNSQPQEQKSEEEGSASDNEVKEIVSSENLGAAVSETVMNIESFVPKTRSEALLLLKKSAEYFSKAEPTSPVPFLINRALRMSNMNFIDLLGEIDPNALDRGREQLGVKNENQD